MADVVGEDEVVLARVERLALAEQLAGELGVGEALAPLPVVPCRMRTALRTTPLSSRIGLPRVR